MAHSTTTSTVENLSRLASKPGVQSTLILSKTDGSILQSTGLLATSASSSSDLQEKIPGGVTPYDGDANETKSAANNFKNTEDVGKQTGSAEAVAKRVFTFVSGAQAFADSMATGDDVKLLRMRTKNTEIVIVPDPKFILVVIQDA